MPRYDYRCAPCDTSFEITRSINDRGPVTCPSCGIPARRIFSPVGVVFKGSGFHSTDYPSDKTAAATKNATESGPAPAPCGGDSSACAGCPASAE